MTVRPLRAKLAWWQRTLRHRRLGTVTMTAVGVLAAIVFFVVGTAIRLLIGPVSLGPFAGMLSGALAEALPGISMKYDQAAIEWSREEGKVSLVILGTRVYDADGRIVAQAPKASIDLAATPLIEGKAVVRRIALIGVQVALVRTKEGTLLLGVGGDRKERDILDRIAEALSKSEGPSSLESFAVRRARFALYDESTKLFVVSPRTDLRMTATSGGKLNVVVDAAVEMSGRSAHLSGEFIFPPHSKTVSGRVALAGFDISTLAAGSQTFEALKDVKLKTDLAASFALDGTEIASVDFTMRAAGAFRMPSVDGPIKVADLDLRGRYDGKARTLKLSQAAIDADRIKGAMDGSVALLSAASEPMKLAVDLKMRRLSLNLPGVFGAPVDFQNVTARASWAEESRELAVDKLIIEGKPFALHAAGRLSFPRDMSAGIFMKGETGAMSVGDLVRYWPLLAARGARAWVDANMPAGKAGPIVFDVAIAPGAINAPALPASALTVTFPVVGADVRYIDGLTHLTGVRGRARLTGADFAVDVDGARIGPLIVGKGRFFIPDLNIDDQVGEASARIEGALPDVLALIDMKPLRYPTRFGIDMAGAKGRAAVDVSVSVPLRKSLDVDAVKIAVAAHVDDLGLALSRSLRLSDGAVDVTVDNTRLRAAGTVGLNGSQSRLAVDWSEDFASAKPITSRIALKGALDSTARDAFGLPLSDSIRGTIGIGGTLSGRRGALTQGTVTFDLTPVALKLNAIGLDKPAGFAMSARVGIEFGAHSRPSGATLHVSGQGASVNGTVAFDEAGALKSLQLPQVRMGPRNDFELTLTRGAGGTELAIHGRSLDGSRLNKLAELDNGGDGGQGGGPSGKPADDGPFHASVKLDRLALREGVTVGNVALDISGSGDRPTAMTLSGMLGKGPVTASLIQAGGTRAMSFTAQDAGQFFKGLYGFSSMRGGTLGVTMTFPNQTVGTARQADAADFKGKLTITGFRIVDQPFLTRLFTAGSLGGLVNLMQGEGIAVDKFDVPFSSRNRVLSVREARATGPAIGLTADGYIDRPNNQIALKGTLVPLYGLNSVLGGIPLLGDVLTSKQGEGIFGMSYEVEGNADEPTVSMNPLSVLAPGILRRIFEGKIPSAAQAPSNNPAPKGTSKSGKEK